MNSMKYIVAFMGFMAVLSACHMNKAKVEDEESREPEEQVLTGGDKDAHGCIGSAGYTWSKVRQDCIRLFEIGVKLKDRKNANATSAAFLVFAADSLKAELFLPTADAGIILDKQGLEWGNGIYRAYQKEGKWTVDEKNAPYYAE